MWMIGKGGKQGKEKPPSPHPTVLFALAQILMCVGDGKDPGLAFLLHRSLIGSLSFPACYHQYCLSGHFLLRFVLWEDANTLGQAAGL